MPTLGPTVIAEKIEAILFYDRSRPSINPVVPVRRTYSGSSHMKYLDFILDSRLTLFSYVKNKMITRALFDAQFKRFLGVQEELYIYVLTSVTLYGAPM